MKFTLLKKGLLLSVIALLYTGLNANAQKFDVKLSADIMEEYKTGILFLGQTQNYILGYSYEKNPKLVRFSKKMLKLDKTFNLPFQNTRRIFTAVSDYVTVGNKSYILEKESNFVDDVVNYSFREIDLETFKISSTSKLIYSHTLKLSGDRSLPSCYFKTSENDKFLLMFFIPNTKQLKNEEMYKVVVFNDKLKTILDKDIASKEEKKKIFIDSYIIDDEGVPSVLTVKKSDEKNDYKKIANLEFKLLRFEKPTAEPRAIAINLGTGFITDANMMSEKDGSISIAGLYDEDANIAVDGYFYLKVENNKITSLKTKPFSEDFLYNRYTDKTAEKIKNKQEKGQNTDLRFSRLKYFYKTENGYTLAGAIKIRYYSQQSGGLSYPMVKTEDILVFQFKTDGTPLFDKRFPFVSDNYEHIDQFLYGFLFDIVEDQIRIIYNSNEKQLETAADKLDRSSKSKGKNVVAILKINAKSGNTIKAPLYAPENVKKFVILTNTGLITGDDTKSDYYLLGGEIAPLSFIKYLDTEHIIHITEKL